MKVWLYPEKTREDLGARRFEVYTCIVKPESIGKDEIDIDEDLLHKRWGIKSKTKAQAFAQGLLKRDDLAFGAVTIQEQVVGWFVEEDGIGEWQDVGEAEEVTA